MELALPLLELTSSTECVLLGWHKKCKRHLVTIIVCNLVQAPFIYVSFCQCQYPLVEIYDFARLAKNFGAMRNIYVKDCWFSWLHQFIIAQPWIADWRIKANRKYSISLLKPFHFVGMDFEYSLVAIGISKIPENVGMSGFLFNDINSEYFPAYIFPASDRDFNLANDETTSFFSKCRQNHTYSTFSRGWYYTLCCRHFWYKHIISRTETSSFSQYVFEKCSIRNWKNNLYWFWSDMFWRKSPVTQYLPCLRNFNFCFTVKLLLPYLQRTRVIKTKMRYMSELFSLNNGSFRGLCQVLIPMKFQKSRQLLCRIAISSCDRSGIQISEFEQDSHLQWPTKSSCLFILNQPYVKTDPYRQLPRNIPVIVSLLPLLWQRWRHGTLRLLFITQYCKAAVEDLHIIWLTH